MEAKNMSGNKGYEDYYKQLEGFKIKQYVGMVDDDGYNGFPQFIMSKRGFKDVKIDVSCDPEGNGGGFLFIGDVDEK
jgi:hypothetical protein